MVSAICCVFVNARTSPRNIDQQHNRTHDDTRIRQVEHGPMDAFCQLDVDEIRDRRKAKPVYEIADCAARNQRYAESLDTAGNI